MQSPNLPQSPSYTPTSSVRASLDLSSNTNVRSSSPGPNSTAQRRNRAALRDYYNLKSKPPGPGPPNPRRTGSDASTTSAVTVTSTAAPDASTQPTDAASTPISTAPLDDPAFEPEPYIASLLATSNLKTVLKVEATLVSEIRNLDGERKALVYDNYSKLIKATRTIGGMRVNMNGEERDVSGRVRVGDRRRGGLSEDGMRDLGERLGGVRRLAEDLGRRVEGEAQEGAEGKRKAKEEREKRQLVRWVLDGPRRLRRLVGSGQLQEAEAEWKVLHGLLDKWEGVKGVEGTRKACDEALHPEEAEEEENGDG